MAVVTIRLNLPQVAPRKGKLKKKKKNRLNSLKKSYDSAEASLSKLVNGRVIHSP